MLLPLPVQFALEVVEALVEAVGAHRVGLRLSPFNDFLDCTDSTPYSTFMSVVQSGLAAGCLCSCAVSAVRCIGRRSRLIA
jgi:2,4-dienoyl-CoA reductase-like NADH-dependent reductase (Old Yellow Enzyme family)